MIIAEIKRKVRINKMGDICIKCKKQITDDYNRCYHDETKDGEPLYVHGDCNKEDNKTEVIK